ncbi:MAG TPA: hypothetical protein VHO25_00770 [Polyangiaceae bacterium]|nr:hypothetical protein [Polyangiaceae bacterium]
MGLTVPLTSVLGSLLALGGLGAVTGGVYALGQRQDLSALLWLAVGGLLIKAGHDLLNPGERR